MFLYPSVNHSGHRGCLPLGPGGVHPLDTPPDTHPVEMAIESGGTHPTRMHSCYRPQTKFVKVMFCLSTGGVSAPLHAGIHPLGPEADTPLGRHPPGRHPLGRHPPARCMLGYTPPQSSACWDTHSPAQCMLGYTPLAQCMLGYGQQAGGTHPTGMHSCYQINLHDDVLIIR